MGDHHDRPRTLERHCDVAVVAGSAAGLAAALELARRRRSVIVVDAGEPRHGDAASAELLVRLRAELRSNGGEILAGRAGAVTGSVRDGYRVELAGGTAVVARRVVAPTDLRDADDAADGSRVGAMIGSELAGEDRDTAARPSANAADWEHRYGADRMWSGNPNGTLVHEVTGLAPGRALDVGAGEGADAIWLAEQGWQVTAADISGRALDRMAAEASRRSLHVEALCVDANAPAAFAPGGFDLVTAFYASIPRTADDRGVHNLMSAVAPGGMLLVVSHDLAPMRAPIDTTTHSRAFDPDAYVRVDDIVAALTDEPDWEIEVHELRPRPPGAASASHHVDDVVLRARRRS